MLTFSETKETCLISGSDSAINISPVLSSDVEPLTSFGGDLESGVQMALLTMPRRRASTADPGKALNLRRPRSLYRRSNGRRTAVELPLRLRRKSRQSTEESFSV